MQCGLRYKIVQSLENSIAVPQKLKQRGITDPVIPFLDIYSREMKTSVHIKIHTQMFIAIYNSQNVEKSKCPSIDK